MNTLRALSLLALFAITCGCAGKSSTQSEAPTDSAKKESAAAESKSSHAHDASYVLGRTMERIDGDSEPLTDYQGDVVLIVNVASKCGLTPQYEELEALYNTYRDRGFVVLGFPANNFRNQEPGSNTEIARFCSETYGVTFPMFAKISVKGDDINPLYKQLTTQPAPVGGEVQWNFQKYLVDRDGEVVAMFSPRVTPMSDQLKSEIERLLDEG